VVVLYSSILVEGERAYALRTDGNEAHTKNCHIRLKPELMDEAFHEDSFPGMSDRAQATA
jgi:hypothetical protein